ncbi:MAG: YjjG family noncanonical pyrimidine nucleotidase [Marinifilaceae bacterium]|jgi:putative hydrolase of the HAD superfamily
MKKQYQHIFFDLDRTLWDFDRNSEITLEEIYRDYQLQSCFGSFLLFKSRFEYHNKKLWVAYYQDRIKKEVLVYRRFYLCLKEAGLDDLELAKEIAQSFIELSPLQTKTFPNTHETLAYLKEEGYQMHIITNGFNEVQGKKLRNCGLNEFFTHIITSEDAGHNKPHPEIFSMALSKSGAKLDESLMIGDDLKTDILGARQFGMDQVFFNPKQVKSDREELLEIQNLLELREIL